MDLFVVSCALVLEAPVVQVGLVGDQPCTLDGAQQGEQAGSRCRPLLQCGLGEILNLLCLLLGDGNSDGVGVQGEAKVLLEVCDGVSADFEKLTP